MDYSTITKLNLCDKGLTKLPDLSLYTNLKKLDCSCNKIATLDNLPLTLTYLDCYSNQITSLDNLPLTLTKLDCSNNKITSLNNLPLPLKQLYCYNNPLPYDFKFT